MSTLGLSRFDYALTLLANRLVPPDWYRSGNHLKAVPEPRAFHQKRKMVFLLGAGCSRQYGLPSFVELLTYLWEDCLHRLPEQPLSLEILRDQLDTFWQAQGPEDRRGMLNYYLGHRVNGATCPGYLHLAKLAKEGYVKAVINMNFDTLLEQAMEHVGVPYKVATSFLVQDEHKVIIYKPHGTIGWVDPDDVIDGILRIVQKLLKLGADATEERKIFKSLFLRAAKEFGEVESDLTKPWSEVIQKTKELLEMCDGQLDDFGLKSPQAALVKAVEDIVEKNRDPVRVKNELILDIANSDLFSDPGEQKKAQELLTEHDVVSIGYSGVDAKIASALRAFPPDIDPKDRKLFVVNVSRPDPRIFLVMAERGSQDLLISGQDAAFENFMYFFYKKIKQWEEGGTPHRTFKKPSSFQMSSMSRPERKALKACLKMALDIRLAMNVAEHSKMSIEEHGHRIFASCLELARQAGICLSSPEKYLLHCAAYLHDLGYYRGYTRAKATENPGWTLLCRHGFLTKELLAERFREDPNILGKITPKTYREKDVSFEDLLCTLCEGHSGLIEVAEIPDTSLLVDGVEVPVRFELILALFALAEDIAEGHPFLPSPDSFGPDQENSWVIVDPVLDLYLSPSRPIRFVPERRRILVRENEAAKNLGPGRSPAMTSWLLSMASLHIRRFDEIAKRNNGWGIKLVYQEVFDMPGSGTLPGALDEIKKMLRLALLENLDQALLEIKPNSVGEASSLLDLISIYTISTNTEEPRIPWADLPPKPGKPNALTRAVQKTREALGQSQIVAQQGLLQHYILRKSEAGNVAISNMDRIFVESFERIIYPAWRFFARNWHDGIETLLMARACLDLGSSRFRGETLAGVRKIIDEHIHSSESGMHAYAHQRCTLCTSRLLYVLANARRLFPESEYPRLDQKVKPILRYLVDLDPDAEIWWGLEPTKEGWSTIHSADYLTWAARAISFCLSVDLEFQHRTGEGWLDKLGFDRDELHLLLNQRWDRLLGAKGLLNDQAEEPHSYIFGRMALACLDLLRLDRRLQVAAVENLDERVKGMAVNLASEADRIGVLSQMSLFNLWPLKLLLDASGVKEDAAAEAVDICYRCVYSPVWIKGGGDGGSWGFNVKNTQTIVTSLVEFWRYALQSDAQRTRLGSLFDEMIRVRGMDNQSGPLV